MQQAVLQANEGALNDARSLMARALADALPLDPIYAHLQAAAGAIALKDNDLPGALDLYCLATADLTKSECRAEPSARAERVALEAEEADYGRVQNAIDAGFPHYDAFANLKPNDILATMALLGPDEVLIGARPGARSVWKHRKTPTRSRISIWRRPTGPIRCCCHRFPMPLPGNRR